MVNIYQKASLGLLL